MKQGDIDGLDLDQISQFHLNGRDIKNVVKRSVATAKGFKTGLTNEIVQEQVLDYNKESEILDKKF